MVTFTITQINDALGHIMRDIADHMRKETVIDLTVKVIVGIIRLLIYVKLVGIIAIL